MESINSDAVVESIQDVIGEELELVSGGSRGDVVESLTPIPH
jgi:hypothetical protein